MTATTPERMLYSPDSDIQSVFVGLSDCLSHYQLLTTSPRLFLAWLFFSHFQRKSYGTRVLGSTDTVLLNLSPCHFSPFPACERHFLSFPVLWLCVRPLPTLLHLFLGNFRPGSFM